MKANPGKATAATHRRGQRRACLLVYFQNNTGTSSVRALSRRRAGDAGPGRQPDRPVLSGGSHDAAACARRQDQGVRRTVEAPLAAAPDVPTMDEAGVPGLYLPFWHGLWAPKGTPKEIVATLNAAVTTALADPAVQKRLADLGHDHRSARATDAGGARQVSQGGNREVVADHQRRRRKQQGAVHRRVRQALQRNREREVIVKKLVLAVAGILLAGRRRRARADLSVAHRSR